MVLTHRLLKRGEQHKIYCEDFLINEQIAPNLIFSAVFDGCSSGLESHFVSALFGKIFRKTALTVNFNCEVETTKDILNAIVINAIGKTVEIKKLLNLSDLETLTTVIALLFDTEKQQAEIVCFGDGVITFNTKSKIIDQNNRPQYLVYSFDKFIDNQSIKTFVENEANQFSATDVKDVSIATDGILSFRKQEMAEREGKTINPLIINFLTSDKQLHTNKTMLNRKCNILRNTHNVINLDDIALVRHIIE